MTNILEVDRVREVLRKRFPRVEYQILADTALDVVNSLNELQAEKEAEDKARAYEAEQDRLSEPPGSWKPVKGFKSASGWES